MFLETIGGEMLPYHAITIVSARIERPENGWSLFDATGEIPDSLPAAREVSVLGTTETFLVSERTFGAFRKAIELGRTP